jgi:hypothetical protein
MTLMLRARSDRDAHVDFHPWSVLPQQTGRLQDPYAGVLEITTRGPAPDLDTVGLRFNFQVVNAAGGLLDYPAPNVLFKI